MSKTRDTGFINNILKYDNDGNVSVVSGSTTLLFISSSGAIITTGIISGSNALSASYAVSASNSLAAATASYVLNGVSASYAASASNSISGAYAVNSTTASFSLTGTSASYAVNSTTASYAVGATNAANSTLFNNTASSVFATTGSNTLTGVQYVSNTNNAIGFSNTTASIYTDGGLQVTKDAYYSSSMFIKGNLTVFGTQSVSFITSSQLNISTNIITVNTSTPSVRFGGLAVQDSGSTGLTGSILWDSQDNQWIYTNPSGSEYDSALFLVGPRNSSALGSEVGITTNALAKGNGAHHMTSSAVFEVSGSVGIGTSSPKSYSSLTSAGQIIGLNNIAVDSGQSFRLNNYYNSGTVTDRAISTGHAASFGLDQANGGITFNISAATSSADSNITTTERMRITSAGRVGIGTTNPNSTFHVYGNISELGIQIAKDGSDTIGGGPYIALQNLGNSRQYIMQLGASNDLLLNYWGGSGYNERLRIASGGNVGIGNWASNTPQDRLHINGAVQVGFVDALNNALRIFWNGASSYGAIQTSSSSNLILNPSGNNVGIGTTSINSNVKLKIKATSEGSGISLSSATFVIARSATDTQLGIGYYTTPGAWVISSTYGSDGAYQPLAFATSDVERMRITSAGNVGIGTTSTNYKLQVDGRVSCGTIVQGNLIAGQISGNLNAAVAPNFILLFNMTSQAAGWSLAGTVNAAAWDCWNISTIWIRRLYDTFTVNAGITGLYKSGCDFAICDITYGGARYIALRFTSNPEIDVMWTGYGLNSMFNSDGSVQVVSSGVTVNSIIASY